ncbi:MAG: hypothetical protein H0T59_00850 [Chloroflexi bacterium]|nr:hypothetical protein [Chloroflexota bacterium]
MYRIRRFRVVKTANVVAVIYMLIIAIIFVPIVALILAFGRDQAPGGAVAVIVGGVFVAIAYAIFGWIFTAIACAIYILASGWVGGIEVQIEKVEPAVAAPTWGPPTAPPSTEPRIG